MFEWMFKAGPKAPIPPPLVIKAPDFKSHPILDNCPVCGAELSKLATWQQQSVVTSHLITCLKEYVDGSRGHSEKVTDLEG